MLKRLEVKHFKSLDDFAIDFEPLTVLIGQNGSGKTTVLQALDLLGAFLRGDVNHYLKEVGWSVRDLISFSATSFTFEFRLFFVVDAEEFRWEVRFDIWDNGLRVLFESLRSEVSKFVFSTLPNSGLWDLCDSSGTMIELPNITIQFKQSIMRAFKIQNAPLEIEKAAKALENIFFLDIESTQTLRKPSKGKAENVGSHGEFLATYLDSLAIDQKEQLNRTLGELVPQILKFGTLKAGEYVYLALEEKIQGAVFHPDGNVKVSAEHVSAGSLRILAILATITGGARGNIVLLEEVENGIDPHLSGTLVQLLEKATKEQGIQIILTTHSAPITNYITEDSIVYVGRDSLGNVRAYNLFDRPELKNMLKYMNPGEVWLNLDHEELIGREEEE